MLYLDTSVVVTAYTREPDTTRIVGWLADAGEQLAVSEWVKTEFASAISIRMRAEAMNDDDRHVADRAFNEGLRHNFMVVGFGNQCFQRARELVANYRSGLRAGDALHLAIAELHGAVLCTRDRRMAAGAEKLGLSARFV